MDKGQSSGRRQSPRKQDKAEKNNDNVDDKLPISQRPFHASRMIHVQQGPPPPSRYNMVGQFGGPCFNPLTSSWKTSFQVEADGNIDIEDESILNQVRHLGDSHQQIYAATNYAGQLANQVTGRLFCTILYNSTNPYTGEKAVKEKPFDAPISGFWLDKTKFITCAHFLESVDNTNYEETEKFLRAENPIRPRAFVSNKRRAANLKSESANAWPVYLLRLSKPSDIAIFELTPAVASRGHYPTHSIHPSEVSSELTVAPSTDTRSTPFGETNLAYLSLFAAYYPCENIPVSDSDLSPIRKTFASQHGIEYCWDLWSREATDTNPVNTEKTPVGR